MDQVFTARTQYSKKGLIRFIGHLDTARLVMRALRCSGLPVKYTGGFSPHVKVSFGPPLPLGFTSDCEFFDTALEKAATPPEIKHKLQQHLPQGITIEKAAVLTYRPSALFRIIDRARYRITLPAQYRITTEKLKETLSSTTEPETIDTGEKTKMIRHIESMKCIEADDKSCIFEVVLREVNKGAPSIKKIFALLFGIELLEIDGARIHRLKLWSSRQNL